MYYIKVFGRMLELQNEKIGLRYSRPETLRAARMNVNKRFSKLADKSIYVGSKFNQYGTAIEFTKVL